MGQAVISDKEGRMFIVGGVDEHGNLFMDVHMLDLKQDPPKWNCLYRSSGDVNEPEPRVDYQMALWKDQIFVLGGSIPEIPFGPRTCGLKELLTFNISDRSWSITGTKADPRAPAHLVSLNGFLKSFQNICF